jgi:hypothetical protein
MGSTEHDTRVMVSVSAADEVTSVSFAYRFSDACSGTLIYTDLAVPIRKLEPPAPPPFDQPGFAFGRTNDDRTKATAISGVFSADRRSLSGQFLLVGYSECGSVLGKWNALRH